MSLFRPQRPESEKRTASLSAAELILLERNGGRIHAGVPVNDEQAMRLSAVWGCVDLIAEVVSTLPVHEFRNTGPAGTPVVQDDPPLLRDPDGEAYGFEVWARSLLTSLLLRGNAYGLVTSLDDRANPRTIQLVHPDRVSFHRDGAVGNTSFFLDNQPIDRWPFGDAQLWHLPAYTVPGHVVGLSPISYAAQTIGVGLAAQRFGAQWFGDGAHPTGMLTNDDAPLVGEDDAKALKHRLMNAMSGNREPLVLGGGWELKPIQVSPEESQFLETQAANADDIARFFFRRPPGEGGEITYANVEARALDMLTFTLTGWLVRVEKALTRLRPRGRYIKFNADAFLRVDTETRAKVNTEAVRGGWATPNERRVLEENTPLPGGDELLWPPYRVVETVEPTSGAQEGSNDAE